MVDSRSNVKDEPSARRLLAGHQTFLARNLDAPAEPHVTRAKIVFTHLPKTGGTSLRRVFEEQIFRPEQCFPDRYKWLPSSEWPIAEIRHFQYFDAHATQQEFDALVGPAHYITMFRDTAERIVSLYWHLTRQHETLIRNPGAKAIRAAAENDLSGWLRHPDGYQRNMALTLLLSPRIQDNSWHRRLRGEAAVDAALDVLSQRYACFGMIEDLPTTMALIGHTFRLPDLGTTFTYRENCRPEGRVEFDDVPPSVRDVIERDNALEVELVARARILFARRRETLNTILAASHDTPSARHGQPQS